MGVVSCLVLIKPCRYGYGLSMAATVAAASVEAAATAVKATTAAHRTAVESTANRYMRRATAESSAHCAVPVEATTASIKAVPVPATSAPTRASPTRASVEPTAEPRTSADEDAAGEVARAVVTVGRAGVRVIPVVTVSADWSWAKIPRSYAYAHDDALGASVRRESQGSSKRCKNHEIFD